MRRGMAGLAMALALCAGGARAEMSGTARAVDGGTLELGGKRIVLFGIEAPPAEQSCQEWSRQGQRAFACGALARAFLQSIVAERQTYCVAEGPARGGETVATCFADGRDLAAAAVSAGWAVGASSRYANLQQSAQQARSGLWAGSSTDPADWGRPAR